MKKKVETPFDLETLKLYNKAFKTFPNSPKQLKIMEEINKRLEKNKNINTNNK